ncbi:hypothetical protein LXL04_037409 [Taraxacum kok-saghyz]
MFIAILMGFSDNYESLRNQILVLDPLPSVHKAYSMALSVEKQKEVQINFLVPTEVSAMMVKTSNNNFRNNRPFQNKSKGNDSKNKSNADRYCDFCKTNGHTKDSCFKIHGYPDWFKELKDKKKNSYNSAHMENFQEHNPQNSSNLFSLLEMKITKLHLYNRNMKLTTITELQIFTY